ncbi:hypothetical protein Pse7367_1552 [Thalassoporum mexicanum PCC 7367]|uniref:hypothetical protein n=1 Tax=Thalassoporum mexicanum TaxID=3457544 RepID=UPI00029FFFA7|nr:hypothetical protein [Pseudanabaena sp. PCC 7367]AFY69841.1 hypothetical protein Pse7367_1552 [Pseudanabaena sp. PCC 7367]
MTNIETFAAVFDRLKQIAQRYADKLIVSKDSPGNYYLDTNYIRDNERALFFGAVQVKKYYVSYHLMPLYVFPELKETISPQLKKRMQGKACFNFRSVNEELFKELAELSDRGLAKYQEAGYI